MLGDIAPFRIAGNLYFVGTHAKSCHVLATSRGLIMIDSGGIGGSGASGAIRSHPTTASLPEG